MKKMLMISLKLIRDIRLLLILSIMGFSCSKGKDSATTSPRYNDNNSGQGGQVTKKDLFQADPTIFEEDGIFYLYGTNDEDPNTGFQVYTSRDLKTWEGPKGYRSGYALSKIENYGSQGFWAPQVWKNNGKYFMAYTADEHIAISSSNNPTGPFVQDTKKYLFAGSQKQIDPFVFRDETEENYLFYVDNSNGNKIFVTGLNNDFMSVKSETGTECVRSSEAWENNGQPSAKATEGPTVIKHGGYYYLLYSANHFQNPNYSVGYATSQNINGPWQKYAGNPIISKEKLGWSGTGHGDLIFKKDGSIYLDNNGNMVYVFHTHNTKDGTQKVPRRTAKVLLKFTSSGSGPDMIVMTSGSFEHLLVNK